MKLCDVLRDWRWAQKINVRLVAKEIGISAATLSRIERGENCDAETLSKILVWLLRP